MQTLTVEQTRTLYTRKKNRKSPPTKKQDNCAWRHVLDENGNPISEPEFVFRSPLSSATWLDKASRDKLLFNLEKGGAMFTTRKGSTVIEVKAGERVPVGTIAWFIPINANHRSRYIKTETGWVRHHYDEVEGL